MPKLYGLGFQYLQPELKYSTYSWVTPVSGKIYALNDPLQNAIPVPAGGQFYFQQSGDYGDLYIKVNSASIPLHNRNFMFLTDEYDWSEDEIADFASFMLGPNFTTFTNYWSPIIKIDKKSEFNYINYRHGSSHPQVEVWFYGYSTTSKNWNDFLYKMPNSKSDSYLVSSNMVVTYNDPNTIIADPITVDINRTFIAFSSLTNVDFITLMFRPLQNPAGWVIEDICYDVYESFGELVKAPTPVVPSSPNLYMQLEKNYNCPCKDNMKLVIEYDETTSNRLDIYKDGELIKTIEVENAES